MFEEKQKHLKQKISLKKRMWLGLFGVLVFLLPLHTTYAIHEIIAGEPTSEGICSDDTPFSDLVADLVGSLGLEGLAGIISGLLSVPVSDAVTHAYLNRIRSDLAATAGNTAATAGNTAIIQSCLEMLVFKETLTDVNSQHAWAKVIDGFVLDTIRWVQTVYNNNPIFVTNQSVYYKLVDKGVFNTFLYEIAFSNIGENNKRTILIALIKDKIRNRFPYGVGILTGAGDENQLAPDGLVEELRRAFSEERFNKLRQQDFNVPEVAQFAQAELSRRTAEIRENEANKLNWGRGFFSYEICDFSGFGYIRDTEFATSLQTIPGDRRNCRVVTPGSLIQDQVSFVLGSALRQMELADEAGESVSANAALVLRNILGDYGLNLEQGFANVSTDSFSDDSPRSFDAFVYVGPQTLGPFEDEGAGIELFIEEGQGRGRELIDNNIRPSAESKFDDRVRRVGGLNYLYPLEFQVGIQLWPGGGIVDEIPDIGIDLGDF